MPWSARRTTPPSRRPRRRGGPTSSSVRRSSPQQRPPRSRSLCMPSRRSTSMRSRRSSCCNRRHPSPNLWTWSRQSRDTARQAAVRSSASRRRIRRHGTTTWRHPGSCSGAMTRSVERRSSRGPSTSSSRRTCCGRVEFVETGRTLGHLVAIDRSVDVDEAVDMIVAEALLAARPVRPVSIGQKDHRSRLDVCHRRSRRQPQRRPGARASARRRGSRRRRRCREVPDLRPGRPGGRGAPDGRLPGGQPATARQTSARCSPASPCRATPGRRCRSTHDAGASSSSPRRSTTHQPTSSSALDVPAFKVGSGELTNLPFLARLAPPRPPDAHLDRHGRLRRGRGGGRCRGRRR